MPPKPHLAILSYMGSIKPINPNLGPIMYFMANWAFITCLGPYLDYKLGWPIIYVFQTFIIVNFCFYESFYKINI